MQVVAVRLTTDKLDALDAAVAKSHMSRSRAIRAALAQLSVHPSALKHGVEQRDAVQGPNGQCGWSPSTTTHRTENYGSASTPACACCKRHPDLQDGAEMVINA